MADTKITITEVRFLFQEETTLVSVIYTSDEPGNPFWGGGLKTKTFPASRNAVDLMKNEISRLDFLTW